MQAHTAEITRHASARATARPRARPLVALARLVETEIVPRLVAARAPEAAWIGAAQVEQLTTLLLSRRDEAAAASFVTGLHRGGIPVEALLLELLTPAARRMGDLWVDDRADFTQVTIGAIRLRRILDDLAPSLPATAPETGRRALFAAAPGDQHTFGLAMVAELFRSAGWSATVLPQAGSAAIASAAADAHFDVAVLSAGSAERLPALAGAIRAVRAASLHRRIKIMVGGPAFVTAAGLVRDGAAEDVGADLLTGDARQAVRQADRLVATPAALAVS